MTESEPLEIWGGVECSILRVGSKLRNQLIETGHYHRLLDIDLIVETGIKTVRYPLLWESICGQPGHYDWAWPDARVRRLRDLGIGIIAGFIHHGSGHRNLHFLQPEFRRLFADYALEVARRYPGINAFTPINEPLTTARISGLYGVWHPHGKDEGTFLRLTLAQCCAIKTAMIAIRTVNPSARLVQTEDVGKTFSTPKLKYQAEYENERRWLAFDLLEGKVDRHHPFHGRLIRAGASREDLASLVDVPCPVDTIGIDYYLTSDRFLDDRPERFPGEARGGNGIHEYVDVAAPRADVPLGKAGRLARIEETWERYRRNIVVTEVHNGCTREEQLRWLMEAWADAHRARASGIDISAVTAWSFFGAVDWDSMLSRNQGVYESGVFDARYSPPRPTVLRDALISLARHQTFDHPVLDRPGWWQPDGPGESARVILICEENLILESCCRRRRMDFACFTGGYDVFSELRSRGAWAFVRIEGDTLIGEYLEGDRLVLHAKAAFDRTNVINAFLDLLIDGAKGSFVLTRADSRNQYDFSDVAAKIVVGSAF